MGWKKPTTVMTSSLTFLIVYPVPHESSLNSVSVMSVMCRPTNPLKHKDCCTTFRHYFVLRFNLFLIQRWNENIIFQILLLNIFGDFPEQTAARRISARKGCHFLHQELRVSKCGLHFVFAVEWKPWQNSSGWGGVGTFNNDSYWWWLLGVHTLSSPLCEVETRNMRATSALGRR